MSNRRHTPHQSNTNCRRLADQARTIIAATLVSGGILSSGMIAWANGPAPGTIIRNQATGSFVDPNDSSTKLIESNVVQVTVAEVAGITVDENGYNEPTDGAVNEGDTVYFDFVITNVGNDPTQFVLPGAANITGGTANGDIQVIEYDPDGTGTSAVDLSSSNITVPSGGGTTGSLGGIPNSGSIPSGGSITVRVPVTAGVAGFDLTVTLGDTAATNGQNEDYVAGTNDVYTDDNTGTANGDTDGDPINGEREASDSLTVAISASFPTPSPGQPQCLLPQNLVTDGSFDNGLTSFPSTGQWSTRNTAPAVINPGNEPTGAIANGYPALGNIIAYNENDSADDALLVTPTFNVDQTYLNGQLDIWFDTYWRHAGGGGSKDSILELRVNGTPYWQMRTINGEGGGSSTLTPLNGATMSPDSPTGLSNPGGGGAFSQWGNVHITIPYTSNATPQIEFAMKGQGLASDDFGIDRIYAPVCAPDRGDAPDTYGTDTTAGNNGSDPVGPSHRIVNDLHLGTSPDGEVEAATPLDGSGDGTDEDGVTLALLTEGVTTYSIPASNITVTNNAGAATLHAWLDFDGNGTFDADEYTSQSVSNGTTNGNPNGALTWSGAGVSDITGNTTTYARFRLTTDGSLDANTPGGLVRDGEVEDYQVEIAPPPQYDISGQVRNDTDNDGDLNDADSGISGVTVALYDDLDGDGDPTGSTELLTTTTDGSGNYSFTDLAPGNYIVIETDPSGYTSTNDSDNFNNNRIAVSLTSADSTGNDFLDSNTPPPGPPSLTCSSTVYEFTWGAGGAVWNINDTFNTYTNVDGSGIDVALEFLDPFNQNVDTGNPGVGAFSTRTDGGYGLGYLTWGMTAQNSDQKVSFVFTFSKPILVDDLQVIDVDGAGYGFQPSVEPGDSFQDEVDVIASLTGNDVPVSVQAESTGTMTITGQNARGRYRPGTTDNLSHTDPQGHMVMATSAPTDNLQLDYSNGPADARPIPNGDGVGNSDGHAIAIDKVFRFCIAPTRTISGQVREDVDSDGDLNDSDSGLSGATVQLLSDPNGDGDPSDGTIVATQITDGSGNFSFTNVDAGSYVIVENNPAGFDSTADSTGSNDDQIPVYVSTEDSTGNIFLDTAAPVASDPDVLLVKRITALNGDTATTNGDNLAAYIDQDDTVYPYDDNTILPVSEPGNPAYDETDPAFDPRETNLWPTPLSTSLRGGIDGGDVMPNDEIEYTIYYLSSGDATAESVLFCDYVPTFTSFIPNAYTGSAPQAPGGIGGADLSVELFRNGITDYHTGANDGDSATYFAPGTDPATSFPGIDCDGDSDSVNANTNGAVVVNLGDLPDAATDATGAYGYVRFRTRVK